MDSPNERSLPPKGARVPANCSRVGFEAGEIVNFDFGHKVGGLVVGFSEVAGMSGSFLQMVR